MAKEENTITGKEATKRLKTGKYLRDLTIVGDTHLSDSNHEYVNMDSVIIDGSLVFDGAVFNKSFFVNKTGIYGKLDIINVIFNDGLSLNSTKIEGDLRLMNVVINGVLDLCNIRIGGTLILGVNKGPEKILVSPNMAELVHWAAPTIPLVVVR